MADAGGDASAETPPAFRPERIGFIELLELEQGTSTYAQLRSGPDAPVPEVLAQEGDCTIYVHPAPGLCEPACGPDFYCTQHNDCGPLPGFAPAGILTISGLVSALQFTPSVWGYAPDPAPGEDLFTPDALVTATAPGDVTPAFTAQVHGVPPLVTTDTALELVDGQDLVVTWSPEQVGRVQLMLVVGWHGAPYEAMLLCEGEDDGSLTVAGTLITFLPRAQNPIFPYPSSLSRFRRAYAETEAGSIELLVASRLSVAFTHP